MTKKENIKLYGIKRLLRRLFFQYAYKSSFCSPRIRVKIYRRGGVDIGQNVYIGKEVLLDEVYPEGIHIGDNCFLTQGTKIITHFYNPEKREFFFADVRIGSDSFLGMNVLIPSR